jgi:hypothetical protein
MRAFVALVWISIALLLPCEPSWCAEAGPLLISVPRGFDGPIHSDEGGGATVAWVNRRPATDGGALLQVSSIDVGASLDGITTAQRAEGAKHYLVEFARGMSQRLGAFTLGEIEDLKLAGLPAARVKWSATVGGSASVGVMYCVLVGHTVVSLQTQDVGTELTPAMYSAMGAIEAVRVKPQTQP